jgi:four helix bundle protein
MNREELERRTLEFSIKLAKLFKRLPENQINYKIIGQLFSSGTSIGANYRKANAGESPKDFEHKIGICFKESRETRYWLSILIAVNPECESDLYVFVSQIYMFYGKNQMNLPEFLERQNQHVTKNSKKNHES